MNDQYTCLLCQEIGESLVTPGCVPNLFALQEHLVQAHRVPWEDVLLGASNPFGADERMEIKEWSLPREQAFACGLSQEHCLRIAHETHARETPFHFVASFPSRESCLLAEMEIIDQCKRQHPTSLSGGAGEVSERPIVVFIDLQPGHEPDRSLQQHIWKAIHQYQGVCIAIPEAIVNAVADTLRSEISTRQEVHPEATWAEVDYTTGNAFYDVPTRSEVARASNDL